MAPPSPPSPEPSQYVNLDYRDEVLDNGLRLITVEDRRVPATAVCLWYDVGSRNEVKGRTGFAHLFEHLMFEGSRNVPRGDHATTITNVGGSYNATTWLDRTNYFEVVPSHYTEMALWYEADRMGGLLDSVTQENLENQRAIVKNERRQRYDNVPCGTAMERLTAFLFPEGHPYHHPTIGYMPDLDAAELEDVHSFFKSYYAPNNCVMTVIGAIDRDQVREWTEKYFGGIPANPNIVKAPDGTLPLTLGGEMRDIVPDKVAVPQVTVGYRSPAYGTPEAAALSIANAVLCHGRGSRFEALLRRDRQITIGAHVGSWDVIGGVAVTMGGFTPGPGVELAEAEEAFHNAVQDIVVNPPTEDELTRVRTQLEVFNVMKLEELLERADSICEGATYFNDPSWPSTYLDQLKAVTPDDVVKAAQSTFHADNRVVLTFVPEDQDAGVAA